jgi:methionine-rich copper-binding protein CopC
VIVRGWLALAGLARVLAGPAAAHSLLLESLPAANATLSAPPPQIALRFNNRIEKPLSRVRLLDAQGVAQSLAVAADGPPDRLTAAVPPLGPGRWRVEWQVLSTDGHVVSGRFEFRLAPSN